MATGSDTNPPNSPWMLVPDVATYARCGRTEVLNALKDGSLVGHQIKIGGKWRIDRADVDQWLRREPAKPIPRRGRSAAGS